MVRHGDFVYIRNNLPGLTGFNIVNHTNGFPADLELVARWRAGAATTVQNEVFITPRPIDSLYDAFSQRSRYRCGTGASSTVAPCSSLITRMLNLDASEMSLVLTLA